MTAQRPTGGAARLRRRDDRDRAALAARAELDRAVLRGEDRVVATDARSRARLEARAALADDDHPGLHVLAGEHLHAEHLRIRVAPVARRAKSLLVRHYSAFSVAGFLVVVLGLGFAAAAGFGLAGAVVFGLAAAAGFGLGAALGFSSVFGAS